MSERYNLTIERVKMILEEESVEKIYLDYFRNVSRFILKVNEVWERVSVHPIYGYTLDELRIENQALYQDILEENYDTSYANPAYASKVFGKEIGEILCFLYSEIRAEIGYAFEKKIEYMTICNELFIEIYNSFEGVESPSYRELKDIVYWYASDYCDVFVAERLEERMNPQNSFAIDIVMNSDLEDLRYLYQYGEYISDEDYDTVALLQNLTEEEVQNIANVYLEGYQEGCEEAGIDLSEKKAIYIQYQIGTERVVKEVIKGFANLGLQATSCRNAAGVVVREAVKNGFYSRHQLQYEVDHRFDKGLFFNKKYVERKLDVIKNVYEQDREMTSAFAGCVLISMEEKKTDMKAQEEAICLNEKQMSLQEHLDSKLEELTYKYLLKELNISVVDIPENE